MDFYLIRHGECCDSSMQFYDRAKKTMNPPLSSKGEEQAAKLAERCKDFAFDAAYSSDLLRALQTANILTAVSGCNVTVLPAFREIDMGDLYKRNWEQYPELYRTWVLHQEDIRYPNGENGEDVWKRCSVPIMDMIAKQYERVAIVTHGGTIRSILCGALGIEQQKRFFFGDPPENCSLSVLRYREKEKRFYLHSLNDVSHLETR